MIKVNDIDIIIVVVIVVTAIVVVVFLIILNITIHDWIPMQEKKLYRERTISYETATYMVNEENSRIPQRLAIKRDTLQV